jgi:hypothetical protein
MKTVNIALCLILLLAPAIARTDEPITIERERVLAIDSAVVPASISLFPVNDEIGEIFRETVTRPGTSGFRLHFQIQTPAPSCSWAIQVLDRNDRRVWSYSCASLTTSDFWSDQIPGPSAKVVLYSVIEKNPVRIVIDRVAEPRPHAMPKSHTPPANDMASILNQTDEIKRWARSVARLRFLGDNGKGYVCTGFLISPDLFITNHHCPQTESEWRSSVVEFDFDSSGATPVTAHFKEFITSNSDLDFAIYRLDRNLNRQPLLLDPTAPEEDKDLLIIQHPGGQPKQVSIKDCIVRGKQLQGVTPTQTDFGHRCDTEGGSSGSPVQDLQSGRVIGLHHLGFNSGSVLPVNRAVRIGLIIDFLRSANSPVLAELGL